LSRFNREDASGGVPLSIGTATQDLRATVEEKLRDIVEAAEAQAHEIEDRALAQALEIEQDCEEKARERFHSSIAQAEQMVAAIDAFEDEIGTALRALRQQGEALAIELETRAPTAAAPPPIEEHPAAEAPSVEEAVAKLAEPSPPVAEPVSPEDAREGVRRRILDLFLAGEPRVEAERMLGRLEDGGSYIDLLDEVYESRPGTQQGSSGRRGGRRRRRPGSPE
jgi:hypothetical protein